MTKKKKEKKSLNVPLNLHIGDACSTEAVSSDIQFCQPVWNMIQGGSDRKNQLRGIN